MLPLRVVIDTNVLVSAAMKPENLQRTTLVLALTKPARMYVSAEILAEYAEVLARRELKIRKGLRLQLLELIRNHSQLVKPSMHLDVASDPDDNIFLECADAAKADYLVTGNQKHFSAILETHCGDYVTRIHRPCGSAPARLVLAGSPEVTATT